MTATELEVSGWLQTTPTSWVLHFGWATNPLPMNGSRGHWSRHSALTRSVKQQTLTSLQAANIPPLGRCTAQLIWHVTDHRVRDADNLAQLEKPMFDAIVLAGIVADDRPELMDKPRALIVLADKACFTLTITALAAGSSLEVTP